MKNIRKVLMLLTAMLLFGVGNSNAQLVVRFRPNRPGPRVVIREGRPSPRHVWVDEEWVPRGRTYVYRRGHWAEPVRSDAVWVAGHWDHRLRGYVWVAGHWR
ncbi:MAG: hypothetical protein ABI367_00060 [Mucilaginibacter sp.]